nr:class I SAM-dependent methyltransferase [Pedococcus badiiscoriae]
MDSWTDVGERRVLSEIADRTRGRAVLDVGVGTGRSTWLLRLLTADYLGIDYEPSMLERARDAHPGIRFSQMDARDLSELGDDSFALTYFSHAGLDSLDHEGRATALRELARVTKPDGLVVYSTLNRRGEFFQAGPGPVDQPQRSHAVSVARFAARAALHPRSHLAGFRNVRGHRSSFEDHVEWAIDTMPTHDWALLVHFTTVPHAVREAAEAHLEVTSVISREGDELSLDDRESRTAWFHVVARPAPGETRSAPQTNQQ